MPKKIPFQLVKKFKALADFAIGSYLNDQLDTQQQIALLNHTIILLRANSLID